MAAKVTPLKMMAMGNEVFNEVQNPNWVDSVALSSSASTYDVDGMRTAAGLVAGQSVYLRITANEGFWYNPVTTAVVPTSKTDGSAPVYVNASQSALIYCGKTVTSISFIAAGNGAASIEVFRP